MQFLLIYQRKLPCWAVTWYFLPHEFEFESSVISFGSKTHPARQNCGVLFESSVISFGSKTECHSSRDRRLFESSVISFGSKTECHSSRDKR